MIHNDIDRIIRDIRGNHRKDTLTADVESPAAEIQKQLQDAMSYEGSEEEKKARLFLSAVGIDYDKLSKEDFVTLMGISKKSNHFKSHTS